jgi:tetratricopeptide (TPR) repeat protein
MGRADEATTEFERAIALDPNDWYAYNRKGKFLMDRGLIDLAEKDFEKISQLAPANCLGFANRGILALLHRGDRMSAKRSLEQALAMDPPLAFAAIIRMYLGWALLDEDCDRGLMELQRAARDAPMNIECAIYLGEALMAQGGSKNFLDARGYYRRALQNIDRRAKRLGSSGIGLADRMLKARCLAALERYSEALALIGQVLAESPDNSEGWLTQSVVQAMAGQSRQSIESMRKAHSLGISEERMREEWPLKSFLKNFKGDNRPLHKQP